MVDIIWVLTYLWNWKVNWIQSRQTLARLVTNTLSVSVVFHNATIFYHITQALLPDKRFTFSLKITTNIESSLINSRIKWVRPFSLLYSSLLDIRFCYNSALSQWSEMANILEGWFSSFSFWCFSKSWLSTCYPHFPHIWVSKDVSPNRQVHQKCV